MTLTISTADMAHAYAQRGWHVLALQANSKEPHFRLAPRAYLSATTDHDLIDSWYAKDQRINIGIAARQSGLVIVDLDRRNLGAEGKRIAAQLPDTYTVATADGEHRYYLAPAGVGFAGKIVDGLDIKHNGYVAAAPSTHPSGAIYTVTNDTTPVPYPVELTPRAVRPLK